MDRAIGGAPPHYCDLATFCAEADILIGNVRRNTVNLCLAQVGHRLVVGRRIVDMSGIDLLLDTADPVEQPRCSGLHPRPGKLFVASIGFEAVFWRGFEELYREALIILAVRHAPRLCRIGDIAVGEEHDRRHELRRDPARLDRAFKRVGR